MPQSETGGMIGRDAERAAVDTLLERHPGPLGLVIEGEAGIGKTTLWSAALDGARGLDYTVLSFRAVRAEARLAFAALADLLEPVLPTALPTLPPLQRQAVEAALLHCDEKARAQRRALAVGVLAVIRLVAALAPVVIAVDDLQWLDVSSAWVLAFTLRRLERERVFVLATQRLEEARTPLRLDQVLAPERLHRFRLRPLELDETIELLRSRFDVPWRRPLLVRVHEAAGGRPLFALELARALVDSEQEPALGAPLPVPENLGALLQRRVAQLPEATRAALLAASAMSNPTLSRVAAAGGHDGEVMDILEPAVTTAIVSVERDRIVFNHPLLAGVVYADASPAEARELHSRIADVLETVEERAMHLALAANGPDGEVASALESAAQSARARGASMAAAQLAELALNLSERDARDDRSRRAVLAAECHFAAGEGTRARTMLEEVVADMPAGTERAEVLRRLGHILFEVESSPSAQEAFKRALHECGGDDALRTAIERDLAWIAAVQGDMPRAAEQALAAAARAARLRDDRLIVETTSIAALANVLVGHDVDARALERSLQLERKLDAVPLQLRPSLVVGMLLRYQQQFDAARERLRACLAEASDRGDDSELPFIHYNLADVECSAGNWDVAEWHAEQARRIALDLDYESPRVYGDAARTLVAALRGRVVEARACASSALALAERLDWLPLRVYAHSALGFLELSVGDHAAADRELRRAYALTTTSGFRAPLARVLANEIEASVALGELAEAEDFLRQLEEQRVRGRDRPWLIAAAGRCRALTAAAEGEFEGALASVREALEAHERLSMPFEHGRTLLVKGTIERRAKQKRSARQSLDEARAVFERVGAPLWAEKAEQEIGRISGRVRREGFTATERRMIELVVDGKSNREIADAMFLSVKTIEGNLSRIYRELGVKSRAQLVRKFARPQG